MFGYSFGKFKEGPVWKGTPRCSHSTLSLPLSQKFIHLFTHPLTRLRGYLLSIGHIAGTMASPRNKADKTSDLLGWQPKTQTKIG